jgi:hypothetical protein
MRPAKLGYRGWLTQGRERHLALAALCDGKIFFAIDCNSVETRISPLG